MDVDDYTSIIKYLKEGKHPKGVDSSQQRKQWESSIRKYLLQEGSFRMVHPQGYTLRIVDATQLYLLLYTFHNDLTVGHISAKKMLEKLRPRYFWPNMTKDVEQYVQSYYQCQMKQPIQKINELHPISPSRIFDRWGVDVVGSLPIMQQQNCYIVVAVDYLSRWQKAKLLKEAMASTIANFLYYEIICRYGCFKYLHMDRGTEFVNEIVQDLMEKFCVKHHRLTSYRL